MRRRELVLVLGGAMMAEHGLQAQQKAMPVIGFMGGGSAVRFAPYLAAFRKGIEEAGFIEGQNVAIEYRWAEGRYDQLPAFAADLVGHKVDVIVADGINAALTAKSAASTIPIVFLAGDPVTVGLVASFARPGGNATGVSIMAPEMIAKRLELLFELVPQAGMMAILVNPTFLYTEAMIQDAREAARVKGVQSLIVQASTESEIEAAFGTLVQRRAGGLVIASDVFFVSRHQQLAALALRHAIPAIFAVREFATAGGLISYGASLSAAFREIGIYVGKILNGAKPADLPVQQPTRFELVINLNTAKVLGLTIPPLLLARADEVME